MKKGPGKPLKKGPLRQIIISWRAYKDIILSRAINPEDDDYDILESQVVSDLERAIEYKAKRQLLLDIKAYMSNELPFYATQQ